MHLIVTFFGQIIDYFVIAEIHRKQVLQKVQMSSESEYFLGPFVR